MFEFNPTVFKHKDSIFSLIRCESDVLNWDNSKLSYKLCMLDNNFNVLTSKQCTFKINNEMFKTTDARTLLKKNRYCIEDIKIIKHNINDKIIGVANVLLQQMQNDKPRIFRVGLIELNMITNTIELIKILEIDNMNNAEKNWFVFKHKNKFLVIYKLCPICKIYELNLTNYTMKKYIEFDTKEIINKYDYLFKNISNYYKDLYLSPACEITSNSDDIYNLIVKVQDENLHYYYYKLILNLSEKKIDILPDLLFSGKKYFLNDSLIYNNKVIGCFGVNDQNYEIKYLDNI
tara:strand:- start:266 stop:1135 length:870 start_codon:yes stop_codon:yes gene_type:complete